MIVSSRGFQEYVAMFGLDDEDLDAHLLDCGAGASGFAARLSAQRRGSRVVACDPAYAASADDLRAAVAAGTASAQAMVRDHADRFTWRWYGSPERRRRMRETAAAAFFRDLTDVRTAAAAPPGPPAGARRSSQPARTRYVAAALPRLPFRAGAFDLALASHLIFTWTDAFDEAWHRAALDELLRVARQVRVFPLVRAGDAAPVPYLAQLLADLRASGVRTDVRRVPYAFQVGADELLVLERATG